MVVKNNFNRRLIINRLAFFAGLALLLMMGFGLIRELVNRRNFDRQLTDYKNSISRLQAENSSLSDKIISWEKSSELEGSARTKLGLEKPGEHTVVIVRQTSQPETIIKSNQTVISLGGQNSDGNYVANPAKWRQYFFGQ